MSRKKDPFTVDHFCSKVDGVKTLNKEGMKEIKGQKRLPTTLGEGLSHFTKAAAQPIPEGLCEVSRASTHFASDSKTEVTELQHKVSEPQLLRSIQSCQNDALQAVGKASGCFSLSNYCIKL